MGAFLSGTSTTIAGVVAAMKSVLSSDGWVFDLDQADRIHIHKGGYHFDVSFGGYFYITGCTGYTSGQPAASQPNAKRATVRYVGMDGYSISYFMVSTGNCFYCASADISGYGFCIFWGFGVVENKVGSWDDGQFVHGTAAALNTLPFSTGADVAVRVNGVWIPNASYGAVVGNYEASALRQKMPFGYNAGILALPLDIYCKDIGNSALLHPLGEAPNLYMARGGDVYAIGEQITFPSGEYLFIPETSNNPTVATLMVKMV